VVVGAVVGVVVLEGAVVATVVEGGAEVVVVPVSSDPIAHDARITAVTAAQDRLIRTVILRWLLC